MKIWKRKEWVTKGFDPTQVVSYTLRYKKFEITLQEFFGTITCEISFGAKDLLFTSVAIKRRLNKLFTWLYNKMEDRHQDNLHNNYDPYGPAERYY